MAASQAIIKTASASRYLQQLCKHWAYKFAAEFTPEQGVIPFGDGRTCRLSAGADALTLILETPDAETQSKMQDVVFDHLKRFAFREELPAPIWTAA
ncbi:MAG: DUF2218 domain-containing protein [Caulobacterales bacterium]